MIPIKQTLEDNCLQACIASLFELTLDDVPHFISYGDNWFSELQFWLSTFNMSTFFSFDGAPNGPYAIASGISPRGHRHAVIVDTWGNIIHDPHPDNSGLTGEIDGWYWFTVIDPAKIGECNFVNSM